MRPGSPVLAEETGEADGPCGARPHAAHPHGCRARPAHPAGRSRRCGPRRITRRDRSSSRCSATCRPMRQGPARYAPRLARSWRVMPRRPRDPHRAAARRDVPRRPAADELGRPVHARCDPRLRKRRRSPAADARRRRGGRADHPARGPAACSSGRAAGCCARSPRSRSCRCTSTTAACSPAARSSARGRGSSARTRTASSTSTRNDKYWGGQAGDRRRRVRLRARCRGRADRGQARRARHHARADPRALARAGERARASPPRSRRCSSRRRACATSRSTRRGPPLDDRARPPRARAARSIGAAIAKRVFDGLARPGAVADLAGRSGRRPRGAGARLRSGGRRASCSTRRAGSTPTRTAFAIRARQAARLVLIGSEKPAPKDASGPPVKIRARLLRRGGAPRRRRHRGQDRRRVVARQAASTTARTTSSR